MTISYPKYETTRAVLDRGGNCKEARMQTCPYCGERMEKLERRRYYRCEACDTTTTLAAPSTAEIEAAIEELRPNGRGHRYYQVSNHSRDSQPGIRELPAPAVRLRMDGRVVWKEIGQGD